MKTSDLKLMICMVSAVLLGSMLVAEQAAAESTLEKVKQSGKMLAGIRSDKLPVGYYDENGKLVGFAVDIANAIGQELGVAVELIAVNSKTRIPYLTSGRIDAEFGSSTPTRKRDEVVDYTIIHNWDTVVMLVRKGDSKKPTDYGAPKKVSSTQGNYTIAIFKKLVPDAKIVIFPEFPEAVLALLNGKVDAVMDNRFAAERWAEKYAGKLDVGESFFEDPQAILVRENDSDWRDQLNWILQELWHDGRFQSIYEKHFGYPPPFASLWSERRLQPGVIESGG